MNFIKLVSLAVLLSSYSLGQIDGVVYGLVGDKKIELYGADVFFKNGRQGRTTCNEGMFFFDFLPKLPDTLIVRAIGYYPDTIPIAKNEKQLYLVIVRDKKKGRKPIYFLNSFLTPFSIPLTRLTSVVEKRLGGKNSNFNVEKLSQALELTSDDNTTKEEKKILEGIVTFGNTETVQIMKPRIDIFAIADDESYTDVLANILKNGYSRNPVYHESIDNIIGVLYAKDLLAHLDKTKFKWQDLIRDPFFVPENKKLDDLLSEFQEKKNHLAIVVDEYGGTSGIVTLEDVIEEIVGDISDEFDDEDLSYSKIDENNYVFEGKTTIKDFCKVLNVEDEDLFEEEKGESETLAGFILEVSGKFPKKGDKINFHNYTFTVEALDRKRIKQVKVTKHNA